MSERDTFLLTFLPLSLWLRCVALPAPLISTSATAFLHPTSLLPTTQTPLALQQTTKYVPKPFPDSTLYGETASSKLDRPYSSAQQ